MSSTWKQQKEAFVSDHDGGSLIELIAVAAVVPLCCGARLKLHDAKDSTTVKLAKDTILLVAPIAASLTIGADYMPAMFMLLAAVAFRTQKQQVRPCSKSGDATNSYGIRAPLRRMTNARKFWEVVSTPKHGACTTVRARCGGGPR